jgi:hypothetical protein
MGWQEDREILDWIEDTVEVLGPFWTLTSFPGQGEGFGDFTLTDDFEQWCQNNLAGYWQAQSGTISCACRDDAMLLRLYMGGG